MAEEVEQPKKKVYVETTVVSDATALPTNDLTLAGCQMATRERCKMRHDATLEEMWRIKREIALEYPTLEDYFKGMLAYQEEERRRGVKFVSFPPRKPEPAMA